jgi:DNA-directed RNA polymerase subunit RPC12/RpoP
MKAQIECPYCKFEQGALLTAEPIHDIEGISLVLAPLQSCIQCGKKYYVEVEHKIKTTSFKIEGQ